MDHVASARIHMVNRDYNKARDELIKAIDECDSEAPDVLKKMEQDGVFYDYKVLDERFNDLNKSYTDNPSEETYVSLAQSYRHGIGCSVSIEKAIEIAKEGLDKGFYKCAFLLFHYYYYEDDLKPSLEYLKLGSEHKEESSVELLADCYMNGYYGFEKSIKKAYELYLNIPNNANALYNIGQMYGKGDIPGNEEKDLVKRFEYVSKAISIKNADTVMYKSLAYLYNEGNGCEKSVQKAIQILQQGIDKGLYDCLIPLRDIYLLNKMYKDADKASHLIKKLGVDSDI
jgi:TPR repeat protein